MQVRKIYVQIAEQQEELESLFEQARKVNIENLSRWEQDERLLSEAEIVELKQLIRQTKEKVNWSQIYFSLKKNLVAFKVLIISFQDDKIFYQKLYK